MVHETDPALYALFERVIREASRPASLVDVRLEGARADGSKYRYGRQLIPKEFDQIPWGAIDGIYEAHWYPDPASVDGVFRSRPAIRFSERIRVRIFADSWGGGIGVGLTIGDYSSRKTFAVKGRPHRRIPELVLCDDEGSVLQEVEKMLAEAYEAYAIEADVDPQDYDFDDGRSRFDSLDERNYPLHER